jgi:hypothetical protein
MATASQLCPSLPNTAGSVVRYTRVRFRPEQSIFRRILVAILDPTEVRIFRSLAGISKYGE